jgi:hypothetical protein
MPIQKLNFGSGNPAFVFPLTIGKNSAAILADKDNFLSPYYAVIFTSHRTEGGTIIVSMATQLL